MTQESYDAIVIGGGPAGGQAARDLAKRGHKVLLVERLKDFSQNNFSSAGMTLDPLREFDLPDHVIGAYWNDLVIQCTKECYDWKGEKAKGVVLDFAKLRQFLADDCVAHGGEVLLGHRYESKEVTEDGVILQLQNVHTLDKIKIKAKLAIDATGPSRKVIYDSKDEEPEMVLGSGTEYLIEVEQEVYDRYKDKLVFFLGHKWALKGYSWIFPMENKILKVGSGKAHIKSKDQENTNQTTKKLTEKIIKEYMEIEEYKLIDIHGGVLRYTLGIKDTFYKNKVVAIGDAISAVNPSGGEGIRFAMQNAELACEYVDKYLKNGSANFKQYRRRWKRRKLLKWRLSQASAIRMYGRYSDEQIERRIQFINKSLNIDELIQSLFHQKYKKAAVRILRMYMLKLRFRFQGKDF